MKKARFSLAAVAAAVLIAFGGLTSAYADKTCTCAKAEGKCEMQNRDAGAESRFNGNSSLDDSGETYFHWSWTRA